MLTRGLGRSYGDASLPPAGRGPVASSLAADRILSFDEATGILRAEAGVRLSQLIDTFLSRGFFVPVTPGTQDVTLGGMVAADVHGKNHHVAGTLGAHVRSIRLRLPDGTVQEVSDELRGDVFRATLGGMGLTGHILEATLRLERVPSPFVVEHARTYPDFESLVDALDAAGREWPFTVAWSDLLARGTSLGRGILFCGRWASAEEASRHSAQHARRRIDVPFEMPHALLTDAAVRMHNSLRYSLAQRGGGVAESLRSAQTFFYPLDVFGRWNLLYGRRGFTQYQCVLPRDPAMRTYRRILDVARSGGPGPFLAVVKDCGAEGIGTLSFPMPGLSFALDFPIHAGTPSLVARLNEIVIDAGGRVYLAKDAFTTREQFAAMEKRLPAFLDVRRRIDPERRISSALAERLFPQD